jgi:hypothetical protein
MGELAPFSAIQSRRAKRVLDEALKALYDFDDPLSAYDHLMAALVKDLVSVVGPEVAGEFIAGYSARASRDRCPTEGPDSPRPAA